MPDVLAVVSQSGPTITFFDAHDHTRLAVLELPAEPHELLFDPTRRLLYATITYAGGYYGANTGRRHEVVVIDPDRRVVVDTLDLSPEHAPHGMSLDQTRGLLYVSVEEREDVSGGVVVVDTANRAAIARIDTGAPGPHWFVSTPDGTRGFATNKEAPFVSVVDLVERRMVDRVAVQRSEGAAPTPDGKQVVVAAPPGLLVLDATTGRPVHEVRIDGDVLPVHTTASGDVLAGELRRQSGSLVPGRLHVHEAGSYALRGTVDVGRFPLTITSSPDGRRAYLSAVMDSTVTVVDLERLEVLDTLTVERAGEPGAHGLAYIPAP
ncbi:YncE family protein [Pseudonocardia sp. TRM90224]|uniref:YncE family protein n=1 Tax=Pseudonocardia sp. TRM90224 TaxID=2812678 RepID=UPI001E4EC0AB|nr:YncE family protein [Pseudonocardia sp. TRM90224]